MSKKITLEKLAQITQNEFVKMGEKVDKKFNEVDKRFDEVNEKINALPDKQFVEDLISKNVGLLRKDLVVVMRGEDKKVELLIEILKKKNVLEPEDLTRLNQIKVFPKIEIRSGS